MPKDKSLILNKIKSHYGFASDAEFARFLGIKPQVLANWYARNTLDYELMYTKCVDIDGNFMLSGEGDVKRNPSSETTVTDHVSETQLEYNASELQYERTISALNKTISAQEKTIELLEQALKQERAIKSPTKSSSNSPAGTVPSELTSK